MKGIGVFLAMTIPLAAAVIGCGNSRVDVAADRQVDSNMPPVVNAGADFSQALPKDKITLSGSAEDKDGIIRSVEWELSDGPSGVIIDDPSALRTDVLQLIRDGVYTFRLKAIDNLGGEGSDLISITILPKPNLPPLVFAGPDKTVQIPETTAKLDGSAQDPDGQIAFVEWRLKQGPKKPTFLPPDALNTVASGLNVAGTYVLELFATDNEGAIGTDEVTLTVLPISGNTPPNAQLAVVSGNAKVIAVGSSIAFSAASSFDAQTPVTQMLCEFDCNGDGVFEDQVVACIEPLACQYPLAGEFPVTVKVTDNGGLQSVSAPVWVRAGVPPLVPLIPSQSWCDTDRDGREIVTFSVPSGIDPRGEADEIVSYAWHQLEGVSSKIVGLGNNARVEVPVGPSINFQLQVTDGEGMVTLSNIFWGTVSDGPACNSVLTAVMTVSQELVVPGTLLGLDGTSSYGQNISPVYTWQIKRLSDNQDVTPAGIGTSGTVFWTPTNPGMYRVELTVRNTANTASNTASKDVWVVPQLSCANYFPGSGTPASPYEIVSSAGISATHRFRRVADCPDAHFILKADVDLGYDPNYRPIGTLAQPFTGSFVGADKGSHFVGGKYFKIRRVFNWKPIFDYQGVFGVVGPTGIVQRIEIENPVISGNRNVGGVAGRVVGGGKIETVLVTNGKIYAPKDRVGGITGEAQQGSAVLEVSVTGQISGSEINESRLGGIVGFCDRCSIEKALSKATVRSEGNRVGGIVGELANGSIANSYSQGAVLGNLWVSGFAGRVSGSGAAPADLRHSYSTARVLSLKDPNLEFGVLADSSGTVTNSACYYDQTKAQTTFSLAGFGLPTAELFNPSTYTNWDFNTIWKAPTKQEYPTLKWEPGGIVGTGPN